MAVLEDQLLQERSCVLRCGVRAHLEGAQSDHERVVLVGALAVDAKGFEPHLAATCFEARHLYPALT